MQLLKRFEDFKDERKPIVLTIGTFDGVHRGHSMLLRRVQEIADGKSQTMVITFSNHPSEVLRPLSPVPLLCTVSHRLKLIEETGINQLILTPFTNYLAQHSAASFVERLRQFIPFTHLVLGHDATLGRDRQGNRHVMKNLGQDWGFKVHYMEEYRFEGQPVSSSQIREQLQLGNLERVEVLLGRPYSIYAKITEDNIQEQSALPRLCVEVEGLCLPTLGTYNVKIKHKQDLLTGVCHLCSHKENDQKVSLAIEADKLNPSFIGQEVEVFF